MKILSPRPWREWEKAAISEVAGDAVFLEPSLDRKMEALVDEADVLYGFPQIPLGVIARSRTLRLMHVPSTGVDRFITPEFRASPVILTNSRGVHAKPVAEHAVALMLALAYNFRQFGRRQEQRLWQDVQVTRLEGQTAGLLGLGAIGAEIARKCKAFDMYVIGVRRSADQPVANVDRVYPAEDMDEVLRRSDFVLCSLPLTEETHHLVDYKRFCAMKPTAFFVNVGRGPVVKEKDLIQALQEGRIGGAGLDVFETEPLPQDSPLWQMDNVVVTPHCAGHSERNGRRSLAILVENLRRLRSGESLMNVVDKTLGY